MISPEKAKALKEVLPWEPKVGDWAYNSYGGLYLVHYVPNGAVKYNIFAPSLSQLLAAIEAEGYWWEVCHRLVDNAVKKYTVWLSKKYSNNKERIYVDDTPEDAASDALLWVMRKKASREPQITHQRDGDER